LTIADGDAAPRGEMPSAHRLFRGHYSVKISNELQHNRLYTEIRMRSS
jgi:hypothetical protein